jgi:hypothetical protein
MTSAAQRMLAHNDEILRLRRHALDDLQKILAHALVVVGVATEQERTIRRFRDDLIALGVTGAELDAAGIREPR